MAKKTLKVELELSTSELVALIHDRIDSTIPPTAEIDTIWKGHGSDKIILTLDRGEDEAVAHMNEVSRSLDEGEAL